MEAMEAEISELERHKTWVELPKSKLPNNTNVLPSTWALKVKRFPDGRLRKYKARFVARGDKQQEGVDYVEKYAPVVSWEIVRLVMTLSLHLGWKTKQLDFSNAFVHLLSDRNVAFVSCLQKLNLSLKSWRGSFKN